MEAEDPASGVRDSVLCRQFPSSAPFWPRSPLRTQGPSIVELGLQEDTWGQGGTVAFRISGDISGCQDSQRRQ